MRACAAAVAAVASAAADAATSASARFMCAPFVVRLITTERPEGVASGVAELVGTSVASIVAKASALIDDDAAHRAMVAHRNPYGDGEAARRVVEACAWLLGCGSRPDEFTTDGHTSLIRCAVAGR